MHAYERVSKPPGPASSPGYILWHVSRRWQALLATRLAPLDLTPAQFLVLGSLGWLHNIEKETPTQRRLAEHAGTDPMMTSQILRSLEDRGLVKRKPDPEDGRAMRVLPTAAGSKLVMRALPIVQSVDVDVFDANIPRETLVPMLRKLDVDVEQQPKEKA